MKLVNDEGVRFLRFGMPLQGYAAQRIEIDWYEFADHVRNGGNEAALQYIENVLFQHLLPDGELIFVMKHMPKREQI